MRDTRVLGYSALKSVGVSEAFISGSLCIVLFFTVVGRSAAQPDDRTFTAAATHSLTLGLSQQEVEASLGKPARVVAESWIYSTKRDQSAVTVTFKNGKAIFVNINFHPAIPILSIVSRRTGVVAMREDHGGDDLSWTPALGIPDLGEIYGLTADFQVTSLNRTKHWRGEDTKDMNEALEEVRSWLVRAP